MRKGGGDERRGGPVPTHIVSGRETSKDDEGRRQGRPARKKK